MDPLLILNLALVALFIILTAFFVGAEFSVVKVRMSRIEQLIEEGNKNALVVQKLVRDLDYYLSACQLGITVTALVLGALGEPTVEKILHPVFDYFGLSESLSTILSFAIAFAVVTFLHVVIGELAPKTLAIQYTEKMTLILARPLYWFGKLMAPFIYTLNGSARVFLRMFGVKQVAHEQAHSEEELKIIMAQSFQSGEINKTELDYMENIFTFNDRVVKDILVPRTQVIAISDAMTRKEIQEVMVEHQYTRYPVSQDGDKDRIYGFVNVKEMLTDFTSREDKELEDFIHPIPTVHEGTSLNDTLLTMQKKRVHIALVVDEYGGTAGIVTMEDMLEEIVGEIRDEFDANEKPDIQKVAEDKYRLNGRVLLEEVEEQFDIRFVNEAEVDTIGGWMLTNLRNIEEHRLMEAHGFEWEITEMQNHQIVEVEMRKQNQPSTIG